MLSITSSNFSIDPVGGIRKENINTAKAKKPDTEQSTDKRGSPVCEKSEVNSNDLGFYIWNAIVSQPSKCLKFMTFQEGCFVICN